MVFNITDLSQRSDLLDSGNSGTGLRDRSGGMVGMDSQTEIQHGMSHLRFLGVV